MTMTITVTTTAITTGVYCHGLQNYSFHWFNSLLSTLISLNCLTFHKLCLKQNQKQSPKLHLMRTRLCWKRKEKAVTSDKLNRLFPEATKIFQEAPETTAVTNTEKSLGIWKEVTFPSSSCSFAVVKILSLVESSKYSAWVTIWRNSLTI